MKADNFPWQNSNSNVTKQHITKAVSENLEFCDEDGNLQYKYKAAHMLLILKGIKNLAVGISLECNSIDTKVIVWMLVLISKH